MLQSIRTLLSFEKHSRFQSIILSFSQKRCPWISLIPWIPQSLVNVGIFCIQGIQGTLGICLLKLFKTKISLLYDSFLQLSPPQPQLPFILFIPPPFYLLHYRCLQQFHMMKNSLFVISMLIILAHSFLSFKSLNLRANQEVIVHQKQGDHEFEASNEVTIAIIATNDIHGSAFPTEMMRADTQEKYNYGGLVYMSNMISTIRNQYGKSNTLWLDAGDQFQGGIESSKLVSDGKIMNEFFNTGGLDASAIGNHEFDYGPSFLQSYLKNGAESSLSANLYSEIGEPVTRFLPNTRRSQIIQLEDGVKVGVIGLTTTDTPQTSSGFTDHLFPDYQFKDYTNIVIDESKALRSSGANIVVILSHEGNDCPGQSWNMSTWKNSTAQTACPDGPITDTIAKLPAGTIDAVVQGHRHQIVHFYKNNIPIVGSINGGYYFNVIYITYNKKTKKIVDTSIEGPIPVCEKVFSNTNKCGYVPQADLEAAGKLVNWKFHNTQVQADGKTKIIFDEWATKMAPYLEPIVVNNIYLQADDEKECGLCNLATDMMLQAAKGADFSLMNPGGFRTSWLPGQIQYQHFYGMFPFSNNIQTFSITGKQLKQMFEILQKGKFGFYTSSGLQMKVSAEPHGLLQINESNGFEIVDDRNYLGVTLDFLLNGGDDMEDVVNVTYTPRNVTTLGDFKTLIKPILASRKVITQEMVIDPANPKLIVV